MSAITDSSNLTKVYPTIQSKGVVPNCNVLSVLSSGRWDCDEGINLVTYSFSRCSKEASASSNTLWSISTNLDAAERN